MSEPTFTLLVLFGLMATEVGMTWLFTRFFGPRRTGWGVVPAGVACGLFAPTMTFLGAVAVFVGDDHGRDMAPMAALGLCWFALIASPFTIGTGWVTMRAIVRRERAHRLVPPAKDKL